MFGGAGVNIPQFGRHLRLHGSAIGMVSWPNGNGGHSRRSSKAQAVRIVRESGKSVGTVARELDLTETALRSWVRQAEIVRAAARQVHSRLTSGRSSGGR